MPAPSALPDALRCGPFTLGQARELGVSADVVRGRRFRRLFKGVYVWAEMEPTLRLAVEGARLVLPTEAVFSHHTAAALRGVAVPGDDRIHATLPRTATRRQIRGLVTHVGPVTEVVRWDGVPVTTPCRTFTDLGSVLGLLDLVIAGDALVRRGFTSGVDLVTAARGHRGPGARRARRAAALVRPRVDSPMETRLRLLIVLAGLPEPLTGAEAHSRDGGWIATVDLQYPDQRIALEYDGDLHRTSRRKWRTDIRTRDLLLQEGWQVIVLTADDIYHRPIQTLWRIQDALIARGHSHARADIDPTRLRTLPWLRAA